MRIRTREQRWRNCRWPHEVLGPEAERAVAQLIRRYAPFIKRWARFLAEGDRLLAQDLRQHGRLLLWEWGTDFAESCSDSYVRGALIKRMQAVRKLEHLALGGSHRLRVHLGVPPRRNYA